MLTTNLQTVPYLPRQRNFPNDSVQELGVELDKTYIDIAARVNERSIGIFAVNFAIITGDQWFLAGQPQKQQTLRQVYAITGTGNIPHGINTSQIVGFTKIYGTFTNGTNWYPLPYVDSVAANNQVSLYVTPTNIVITGGAGAGQPAVVSGWVVLEWLSNF